MGISNRSWLCFFVSLVPLPLGRFPLTFANCHTDTSCRNGARATKWSQ